MEGDLRQARISEGEDGLEGLEKARGEGHGGLLEELKGLEMFEMLEEFECLKKHGARGK